MHRVEVFKSGQHKAMDGTEGTYSDATLRVTAAAYDPARYRAPICIGHPTVDAPAYGWVDGLEFADGVLSAWVGEVEPSFAQAVRDGRYRNVSACFWRPDAASNPKAGVLSLRHVGFLGATPPAVMGLKTVSFARAEGETLEVSLTDGSAAFAAPGARQDGVNLASLAARERAVAESEVRAFCDRLCREGRLVPALRGMAETILLGVPSDGALAFAETDGGETLGHRAALMKLLAVMPPVVTFGAVAGGPMPDEREAAPYAPPAGYRVDPARAALLTKAEALMASQQGLSFADAVRQAERPS